MLRTAAQRGAPIDDPTGSPATRSGRLAIAAVLVAAVSLAGCAASRHAVTRLAVDRRSRAAPPPVRPQASPRPPRSPTPAPSSSAGQPTVLLAAGDIGRCDSTHDDATGALVASLPGVIATLGDTAYEDATTAELNDCFGGSWGAVKDRIRFAVMGNHDVHTDDGAPMQAYMGSAATRDGHTWFSDDLGCVARRRPRRELRSPRPSVQQGLRPGDVAPGRPRRERRLVHGRAAPPAAVQQRPARERSQRWTAVGRAVRGRCRPRARRPRSRLRAFRPAGPQRHCRRRHAGSWRSSPGPAGPRSRRSRTRGRTRW